MAKIQYLTLGFQGFGNLFEFNLDLGESMYLEEFFVNQKRVFKFAFEGVTECELHVYSDHDDYILWRSLSSSLHIDFVISRVGIITINIPQ